MKKNIFILTIIFFFIIIFSGFSQNQSTIDFLHNLLKTDKEDTTKVNHLVNLCMEYRLISNFDTALHFGNAALDLASHILREEQNSNIKEAVQRSIAASFNNIGNIYREQGEYYKGLNYFFKSLKINEELGNKNSIASNLGNIGLVFWNQGDYPKALENYFKALKIFEESGNKIFISYTLCNIGIIYGEQKDYPKALEYYFKALKKSENNNTQIPTILGNVGVIYKEKGDYAMALDYYFKALKIYEEFGNKYGIASVLDNIGVVYFTQDDYSKALEYYFKALQIDNEIGNKNGIGADFGNIGTLYSSQKKYKEAEAYLLRAISIFKEIGSINEEREFEENLSQLYSITNKHELSLEHYKKAITLKDSIFNEEKQKEITRKEMNYEFEKKEAATKAGQDKKDAIAKEELKQKEQQRNYFIIGFALVGLLALFIFRGYRQKQKANIMIIQQKKEVEKQKHLVDEKQKEIIDSITYAKRLQHAILPPVELIKNHLPNTFVLYKPKDIVAGDFYWMESCAKASDSEGEIVFIAAADCTGHGVPGAMVSVVCSNALNQAVKEFGLRDTGKILDKVTDLVLETFEKSGEQIKDGMDISLLKIEFTPLPNKVGLQWSGANNPLWYISNGELKEITADKQPIGKYDNRKPFITHNIEHSNNSTFYLFTDGLPDQFGGPKGKKFMYKRFENSLSGICNLPMDEQQIILEKSFHDWKGTLEQVDDITVIGVRV